MKQAIILLVALVAAVPAAWGEDMATLYNGWSVGFQTGVGGMVPAGSLSDDLKGCAVFVGGLTGGYNRVRLKLDLTYGQPSFKNENPYNVVDEQGRNLQRNGTASVTWLSGGCQLGYTVWRGGSVSVTPCAGVSVSRLSWGMNSIKWEADEQGEEKPQIDGVADVHENTTGWMASVDIDIRLKGRFVSYGGSSSHYTSSVRLTPFITHAGFSGFNPRVRGSWLGLTVSYAGLFSLMSR